MVAHTFRLLLVFWATMGMARFSFAIESRRMVWQYPKHILLPVQWELTRSAFDRESIFKEMENYKENWQLTVKRGHAIYLRSPRGQVRVDGIDFSTGSKAMPRRLVLEPNALARLIGLKVKTGIVDEPDGRTLPDELFVLNLFPEHRQSQTFHLEFSGTELYQVDLVIVR